MKLQHPQAATTAALILLLSIGRLKLIQPQYRRLGLQLRLGYHRRETWASIFLIHAWLTEAAEVYVQPERLYAAVNQLILHPGYIVSVSTFTQRHCKHSL